MVCQFLHFFSFTEVVWRNSKVIFVLFKILVETARTEAANYRQQYNRPIPLKILNDRLSGFFHAYTLYSAVRPFGVCAILASYDPDTGPEMYMIEPSGTTYVSYLFFPSKIKTPCKISAYFVGLPWLCYRKSQTIGQNRN